MGELLLFKNVKKATGGLRIHAFFSRIVQLILHGCLLYLFHGFVCRRQSAAKASESVSESGGANG